MRRVFMGKFFKNVLTLAILGWLIVAYHTPFEHGAARLMRMYLPCRQPITYSIGSFDTRFGLSKEGFLQAVSEAEGIWEKPIDKNLFSWEVDGNLNIDFIYDNRQAATVELRALGIAVEDSRGSY